MARRKHYLKKSVKASMNWMLEPKRLFQKARNARGKKQYKKSVSLYGLAMKKVGYKQAIKKIKTGRLYIKPGR